MNTMCNLKRKFQFQTLFLILVNQIIQNSYACSLQCSVEDKDNIPCTAQDIGSECDIPVDDEYIFTSKRKYLPPYADKTQLVRYASGGNTTFYGLKWKLDKHNKKQIKTLKGFLIELKFYIQNNRTKRQSTVSIKYQFYIIKTNYTFSDKNKKSRFHLTCVNLTQAQYVNIKIWSLPSVTHSKCKNERTNVHMCNIINKKCLVDGDRSIDVGPEDVKKAPLMNGTKLPQKDVICPKKCDFNVTRTTPHTVVIKASIHEQHSTSVTIFTSKGRQMDHISNTNTGNLFVTFNVTEQENYTIRIKSKTGGCKVVKFHEFVETIHATDELYSADEEANISAAIISLAVGFVVFVLAFAIIIAKCTTRFQRRELILRKTVGSEILNNSRWRQSINNIFVESNKPKVMLISYHCDRRHAYVAAIKNLAHLLNLSYVQAFSFYDGALQERIMKNSFDWIETYVEESDHFIFVATKELCELFKFRRNAETLTKQDCLRKIETDLANYVFSLIRGKLGIERKCHIISFGDQAETYLNEIGNTNHLFEKAKKYILTKIVGESNAKDVVFNSPVWNQLLRNIYAPKLTIFPTTLFTNTQCNFLKNVIECMLINHHNNGDTS